MPRERLNRICTRTGDYGQTSLARGERVDKDHPRIEAIGEVDTLNSQLGLLLAELAAASHNTPGLQPLIEALSPLQHLLFELGGELAMPEAARLQARHVSALERQLEHWNAELPPLKEFILPGGSRLAAQAHLCRCAARTAERRCLTLHRSSPLRPELLAFLNRLSDLLFVAARTIARIQQHPETLWQPSL